MSVYSKDRGPPWCQWYPVEEKLSLRDPSRPLLVDIGGSRGHDLIEFKQHQPSLQGRLILQHLRKAIEEALASGNLDGIEPISHDFFQPQPVKGAKACFIHHVLHDWPDKQVQETLAHIRQAMGSDSLLLVVEACIPDQDVSLWGSWFDSHMLTVFAALERTRDQWIELLDGAGFEVVKFWEPEKKSANSEILFESRPKG